jgi:hypothetical protein
MSTPHAFHLKSYQLPTAKPQAIPSETRDIFSLELESVAG